MAEGASVAEDVSGIAAGASKRHATGGGVSAQYLPAHAQYVRGDVQGVGGKGKSISTIGGWRTLQLREVHNVRRTEAVQKVVNLDNLQARDRQRAARSCMIRCGVRGTHCA